MAITVSDVLNAERLKNMKLITGQGGLDKVVKKVGILDYEFINKTEGQFGEGDFVISSFLFAKDDERLFVDSVKSLINDRVACLAIKNVYYQNLTPEIIEYADKLSFPIFLFDNSIFFEDLITDITDMVRADNRDQLTEAKIDNILQGSMNRTTVREAALEINKYFRENFVAIYCVEKKSGKDRNIFMLLKKYKDAFKNKCECVLKYKNGILAIITESKIDKDSITGTAYDFISDSGISTEDFYVGISKLHESLNEFDYGVNECLYAVNAGEALSQSITFYNDIGLYKILLPYINKHWMKDFYESLVKPLQSYDAKYSAEFLKTAVAYIDNNGNIKDTAEALFQHENTVRYRIGKIKEILSMENDHSFYEQLSAAVKIFKILNKEYMN
ncbi:MAG: PucR family transcriptional regulator [Sedimentibacter sp.]|uniref:PucR family transcriptional regulator n=1 Tax=Sedimentibacter sp. TaxID=1960295 RepID=UPI0031588302